jgi:hypothetical protein
MLAGASQYTAKERNEGRGLLYKMNVSAGAAIRTKERSSNNEMYEMSGWDRATATVGVRDECFEMSSRGSKAVWSQQSYLTLG